MAEGGREMTLLDPGLVQGDCEHEQSEYLENKWGAEWRRCIACGETLERYQDCEGG